MPRIDWLKIGIGSVGMTGMAAWLPLLFWGAETGRLWMLFVATAGLAIGGLLTCLVYTTKHGQVCLLDQWRYGIEVNDRGFPI